MRLMMVLMSESNEGDPLRDKKCTEHSVKAFRKVPVWWQRWWTGILSPVASETDGCGSLWDSRGGSVPVLWMDSDRREQFPIKFIRHIDPILNWYCLCLPFMTLW